MPDNDEKDRTRRALDHESLRADLEKLKDRVESLRERLSTLEEKKRVAGGESTPRS